MTFFPPCKVIHQLPKKQILCNQPQRQLHQRMRVFNRIERVQCQRQEVLPTRHKTQPTRQQPLHRIPIRKHRMPTTVGVITGKNGKMSSFMTQVSNKFILVMNGTSTYFERKKCCNKPFDRSCHHPRMETTTDRIGTATMRTTHLGIYSFHHG